MTTQKQKEAVRFCEQWLNLKFEGNINNGADVTPFLAAYLEDAKEMHREIALEYEGYLTDLEND